MTPYAIAITVRLASGLKDDAQRYADALGLSLNGLVAVALKDYLGARQGLAASVESVPASESVVAAPVKALGALPPGLKPPKRPRDLCPCLSGKQYRHCHGRQGAG